MMPQSYEQNKQFLPKALTHFTSPLFPGLLKDVTGTYDAVFYINGGLTILGSLVMAIYPLFRTCSRNDGEKSESVEEEEKATVQA